MKKDKPTEDELREELESATVVKMPETKTKGRGGGGGGGKRGRPRGEIFDGCPVVPVGVNGKYSYFLDGLGQLRAIDNLSQENLKKLFGHHLPVLCDRFPKKVQDKSTGTLRTKPLEFDWARAGGTMHIAVGECGVFNPDNSVRGVGAWTDDDGGLIYHLGDEVLYRGEKRPPGRIEGRVYPAQSPIPHPADGDSPADPVAPFLETVASWNWTVPDLHPQIALGMVGIQMLGGALDWRPTFWMLAAAGSGKSEFHRLLGFMHGQGGLIQSTDTTKSGITSQLGQSSLPVAVDELEPGDERSTKERDIIALARVAASGGQWLRGSADQSGVGGNVYSSFMFSSILIPGVMKTQDVQRLIRLELKPLEEGAAKLALDPRTWRARGARLKALLIARWPGWAARLAEWRHSLELAGVTGRDADNWAPVMAMADMAQSDDIAPKDARDNWARKVALQVKADRSDTVNDADAMLLHLMSQTIDPWRRGAQYSIAQWIMAAAGLPGAPKSLVNSLSDDAQAGHPDPKREISKRANEQLALFGLRVYGKDEEQELFIMNKPIAGLNRLFQGSDWAGGVWQQSAKRVPGAVVKDTAQTLAGITSRGVRLPLKSIPGLIGLPMDHAKSTPPKGDDDLSDFA